MLLRAAVALCVVVTAGLAWPARIAAQTGSEEVEIAIPETVWGFDGKATRETFTPLSILIQNPGAKSASGTLRLSRQMPLEEAREPAIDVPFDVPPFEERWIQAAPYIVDDYMPWQIAWGPKPSQRVELPQPRLDDRSVVLLVNPNDRPRATGLLRRFRTNLFPASVTATDGLQAVFLNSVPDLQGARLQAFLEWLRRGGRVILLHADDQQFPKFPAALAALNDPAERFQVGGGEVRRLPFDATDVTDGQLKMAKTPLGRDGAPPPVAVQFQDPYKTYHGRYPWSREDVTAEK